MYTQIHTHTPPQHSEVFNSFNRKKARMATGDRDGDAHRPNKVVSISSFNVRYFGRLVAFDVILMRLFDVYRLKKKKKNFFS